MSWVLRLGWALLFTMLCWHGVARAVTRTRIQDLLFNANGTLASGMITIRWDGFTAADGTTVAGNSLTLRIVNGVLLVDLVPNTGSTPGGTSYTVTYLLEGRRNYTETWVVPSSGASLRVGQVRVIGTTTPPAGTTGPVNIYTSGGNTGIGPTPFTPTTTLEVYDARATTGVTRQILRNGAGQGTTPLLSFHSGSFSVGFRAPALSANTTYTLPAQDGLPGQMLKTDGTGVLTWATPQQLVGEFYQTFQNSGTARPQRHAANFASGLVATDNAALDRTDVTLGPHSATHASGGSDAVTPAAIGALKNTSDTLNTGAASNIGLIIKGAAGQAASLQEWHDNTGALLASITSTGRVFFPEAFFSARPAETATSLFYQVNGLNRFSTTTFAGAYNFNRYDDAGNFKDTALQIVRTGDTNINTSLVVNDPGASAATKVTVKAGAGQATTNLQEWQSSAGSVLSRIDSSGFFQFPAGQKHGSGTQVQMYAGAAGPDECAKFDSGGNLVGTGAGCGTGGSTPLFVDAITPTGTINGVNAVFTLPSVPNPPASLVLARNGLVQASPADFTLSGNTITFAAAAIPQTGDTLLASYRAGAGTGNILIDTADRGYFFGVSVAAPDNSGTTTTFAANVHRVWQFMLPFAATVNQLTFEVVAVSGASTSLSLGLWDAACSTLLVNSGVMSAGGTPDINVAGIKNKAITGGPLTLPAGVYWLAMTTNSTALTLRSLALPSQAISLLNNPTNKKFAQAGNSGSSGAFPSSCGSLTASVSNQPPMVVLER